MDGLCRTFFFYGNTSPPHPHTNTRPFIPRPLLDSSITFIRHAWLSENRMKFLSNSSSFMLVLRMISARHLPWWCTTVRNPIWSLRLSLSYFNPADWVNDFDLLQIIPLLNFVKEILLLSLFLFYCWNNSFDFLPFIHY